MSNKSLYSRLLSKLGTVIANYLSKPVRQYIYFSLEDTATLQQHLQPGDVLLVEGNERISTTIKYLTQSTWSHAAMYVGQYKDPTTGKLLHHQLIEADLVKGVTSVPVDKYSQLNTRICQPVGLSTDERSKIITYLINSLGRQYDQKNIIDLIRYLLPTPPIPNQYRRKMLVLGSGDPTRAICSTLIAEAFQSIKYPILPSLTDDDEVDKRMLQLRHHTLFVPRDFDISPYFNILKPEIYKGFDHSSLQWSDD